ncbi:MAG: hypothetical protein AB1898_26295 [Acidobacteriota bacterium]
MKTSQSTGSGLIFKGKLGVWVVLAVALPCLAQSSRPGPKFAKSTSPVVIVVGNSAPSLHRFAASELQKYFELLSGTKIGIVTASQVSGGTNSADLILLGGPQVNQLVQHAVDLNVVSITDLTTDGFVLWKGKVTGRNCLIVGGNDEASTMYAVYDLLERLGVTFLLNRDVLPEEIADLQLPEVNVRVETPFSRRGLFISNIYPNRAIMDLSEVKKLIDQMAKLKLNYLQFFWFEHEPWIEFDYRGEGKLLGDATQKETGYLMWRYHYDSYMTKDLPVGQQLFNGRSRMAPAEFQNVETPRQAFSIAKGFLTEIIHYANNKKIKVWLCVDPTTLPGNLARFAERASNLMLPFHPILGTHMCPSAPELHEINENRLKALVSTYPDAEGYFLYMPEAYPSCSSERDRSLLSVERIKYGELVQFLPKPFQWGGSDFMKDPTAVLNSIAGSVHIIKKVFAARDRVAPHAKLGIGGLGHAYVLPFLDRIFPKDVPFTDMESRAVWTPDGVPMKLFGGMGKRERTLVPRVDDDGSMFGMPFNVNLYYKDRVLEGSQENELAGFAGQINRIRGTEPNYRYLAEGAWRPSLTPTEFYEGYVQRIFGKTAEKEMLSAFTDLEQNEEYLGWRGQRNFQCCSPIPEVVTAYRLYKQPNPFDGPSDWGEFIKQSHERIRYFAGSVELLTRALRSLEKAVPRVAPQGQEELNYLRNKTESYVLHLQTLILARRAYIAFEEAFQLRPNMERQQFVRNLDKSMDLFSEARTMGRRATEKFAELIDHPSDLGVLYRANLFLVTGMELVEQTMQNVVNFHHGRNYVQPVAWDKIYVEFPQFSPSW